MRRSDRLFRTIQILRRSRRPVTARLIADELQISLRSVYRDIADLLAQGTPIRGEAGIGYILDRKLFDMPPLMLTVDELEVASLGAHWVAERGDPALARAAQDLLSKLSAAVPNHLRLTLAEPSVGAPPSLRPIRDGLDLAHTRLWIRQGRKLRLHYRSEDNTETERIVWPVLLGYAESFRILAAWCELRQGFRHFRTDRVLAADFLPDLHGEPHRTLRHRWQIHLQNTRRPAPQP